MLVIPLPVIPVPVCDPVAVAQSATTASAPATMSSPGSSPCLAARRLSIRPDRPRLVSWPPSYGEVGSPVPMTSTMLARSCGTGTVRRLDSRAVPATRNRPVTGSRPFLATCSAYRAPWEMPARKTGHDRAAPSPSRWIASSARNRASSRSGSLAGGRAGCQAPFQPSGKTVVIPAAGPRLASP